MMRDNGKKVQFHQRSTGASQIYRKIGDLLADNKIKFKIALIGKVL